jgi:isopentenyl diphosphate isomerase/L-lactate dehydrogenase-like FMN-dependent dehydrogenase
VTCPSICFLERLPAVRHEGRQFDSALGSLAALPGIVSAVGDQLQVLFESGTAPAPA